jgi:hypothetical protein
MPCPRWLSQTVDVPKPASTFISPSFIVNLCLWVSLCAVGKNKFTDHHFESVVVSEFVHRWLLHFSTPGVAVLVRIVFPSFVQRLTSC